MKDKYLIKLAKTDFCCCSYQRIVFITENVTYSTWIPREDRFTASFNNLYATHSTGYITVTSHDFFMNHTGSIMIADAPLQHWSSSSLGLYAKNPPMIVRCSLWHSRNRRYFSMRRNISITVILSHQARLSEILHRINGHCWQVVAACAATNQLQCSPIIVVI